MTMNDFSFAASLSRQHTGTVVEEKEQQEQGGCASASSTASFSYTLRGLRDEREIRKWANFCASCFSYKPNPPSAEYFERHYYNDPHRGHVSLIRVAVVVKAGSSKSGDFESDNEEIVASCRIFQRDIADGSSAAGGSIIRAGGIGEVCTSSDHRRRGLSKELLQDCLEIMSNKNMNMAVSFLHAAPAFFPVYQSAGYVGTTSRWSKVPILHPQLLSSSAVTCTDATAALDGKGTDGYRVRLANFPNDTHQLKTLHRSMVSHHGFAGCIIRSTEYWNEYLSQELKDVLWVLEKEEDCSDKYRDANDEKKVQKWNIVAWLAIRPRAHETKWQLRDFGYCLNQQRADAGFVSQALAMLLHNAISCAPSRDSGPSSESLSLELHLPTFVLEQLKNDTADCDTKKDDYKKCSFIDWHNVVTENDEGWMYRPLLSCIKEKDDEAVIAEPETAAASSSQQLQLPPETWKRHNIPHLIWPADSF
jgi:predicted GNAT family N-acyltransferase